MPCRFARPRWQVRLRASVPLGEGKPAGQLGLFLKNSAKVDHVGSLVAVLNSGNLNTYIRRI